MLSVLAGFCPALHEPGCQTGFDTRVRAISSILQWHAYVLNLVRIGVLFVKVTVF